MLQPEYLDGIAEPLQAVYSELDTKIMADIARRIADADYVMTSSAEWQIYKLQQMGLAQEYIQQEVAKTLKVSEKILNEIFKNAGIKSMKTDIATQKAAIEAGILPSDAIPLTASKAFSQVINANARRTKNTLKRLTGTIATDANGKINEYMDMCQLMVQSGAFTQQQAIDATVKRFAADGVGCFDYLSGARTSIEAAVRRACVTGVNQATAEISLSNAAELGTDLVEVTSHADARPEHAEWQGGIYSISGTSEKYQKLSDATGYGKASGLCGANCRHSFYAYIEGISEQVKPKKYDPEIYKNEQKQRYNERMIREWKKRAATLEAGGVDATAAKKKVAEWQARQRELLDKTGLKRDYAREKVWKIAPAAKSKMGLGAGLGNSPGASSKPKFIEKIDVSDTALVKSKIREFEQSVIKEPIEHAYVILANGKTYRFTGTSGRVYPDVLGKALKGATVSHNHPLEETRYSFSKDDFSFFQEFKVAELWGVDEKYQYVLKRNMPVLELPELENLKAGDMTEELFEHYQTYIRAKEAGFYYERVTRTRNPNGA